MSSRLITWLEQHTRQLDIQDAPKNCVISIPIEYREFMKELHQEHWLMCWGEDKEGFDGIVLRCNGFKFFILETKIDF